MLDTIRVKFPIDPTEEHLKNWTRKTTSTPKGESDVYIYNPVINDAMCKFTYYPQDFKGNPLLTLELSLPKLVFGHNYKMLNSIDEAIQSINARLDQVPNIPKLDLAEGILIRLDMCYNHQVGDAVNDYIRAIGNLEYPHRRTKYHRNEGAEFRAKHKTTKFYNKEHESGYAEAYGILRQEITLMDGKDIQKLFSINKPTLKEISKESIVENLKDDLSKIGLLGNSIANRNTALKLLCDTYGDNAGIYYFGLLISKIDKSKKQIEKDAGTHPRSLDRKLKKIVDAGIPKTLTDREEPLPPLTIEL
ncbi:MAG: hypothetical protein HY863_10945 [Chloroflexi bacterium]|nr:hypothetical protein [Chloroflexota bacterium]